MQRFTGLLGLVVILALAFLFSTDRQAIQRRVIFWGLGLQFAFAFLVLKTPLEKVFSFGQRRGESFARLRRRGQQVRFRR